MEKIVKSIIIILTLILMYCNNELKYVTTNIYTKKELLSNPKKINLPLLKFDDFNFEQQIENRNLTKFTSYFTYTTIPEKIIGNDYQIIYKNQAGIKVFQKGDKFFVYVPLNYVDLELNDLTQAAEEGYVGVIYIVW